MDYSSINVPFLKNPEIDQLADDFRAVHWDGKIPVDVDLIAELYGITIIPANGLRLVVNQEAWLSNDLSEIVFDPEVNEVRIRFSIAHELGHYAMHSEFMPLLKPETIEEWKDILSNIPSSLWSMVEYQADEFAGRLLVPKDRLIASIQETSYEQISKAIKELGKDNFHLLYPYLSNRLGKIFNVSHKVVQIRLEREMIKYDDIK